MKVYEFLGHPYPLTAYYVADEPSWNKIMKKWGRPNESYPKFSGCVTFFENKNAPDICVITLNTTDCVEVMHGLMAHEVMHVVQYMEKAARNTFDIETEAYLMQKMLMWLISCWKKSGRKYGRK